MTSLNNSGTAVVTNLPSDFSDIIVEIDKEWQRIIAETDSHALLRDNNPTGKDFAKSVFGFFRPTDQEGIACSGYSLVTGQEANTLGKLADVLPKRLLELREKYFNGLYDIYDILVEAVLSECAKEHHHSIRSSGIEAVLRLHKYTAVTQSHAKHILDQEMFQLAHNDDGTTSLVIFTPHKDVTTFTIIAYASK